MGPFGVSEILHFEVPQCVRALRVDEHRSFGRRMFYTDDDDGLWGVHLKKKAS